MRRFIAVAMVLLAGVQGARAADVVFWGGLSVTSTAGCSNWNPDKNMFTGTYFVPIAGTANGTDSSLVFHYNSIGGEAFTLFGGRFANSYKDVEATHIYTRAGAYAAKLKLVQTPAALTATSGSVKAVGSIKGWDNDADCLVNFTFQGLRNLNP